MLFKKSQEWVTKNKKNHYKLTLFTADEALNNTFERIKKIQEKRFSKLLTFGVTF